MSKVVAILCSDLHFSHTAPSFRSAEPDWYEAMKRGIDELKSVAEEHRAPIICAGDVLDRWNTSSELTNFLIDNLPPLYSIYGQHDAPFHRGEDLHRSAYGTLVRAGTLKELGKIPSRIDSFWVHPFPWGKEITPLESLQRGYLHLAVVHRYIWDRPQNSYPGAEETKRTSAYEESLKGYTSAVFGDNHRGFNTKIGSCNVMNCGTFFRRKSDEIIYRPMIGLLHSDGVIEPHYLDTSKDVYVENPIKKKVDDDRTESFLKELEALGSDSLDFREAVNRYFDQNETEPLIKDMVLEAIVNGGKERS